MDICFSSMVDAQRPKVMKWNWKIPKKLPGAGPPGQNKIYAASPVDPTPFGIID
jgi:hypothetical protein